MNYVTVLFHFFVVRWLQCFYHHFWANWCCCLLVWHRHPNGGRSKPPASHEMPENSQLLHLIWILLASSANSCKCSFDFGIIQNGLHFQRIASFFACKQFLNKEKTNDFQSTFDNNKKYRLFASISCSVSILILSKQITIYNISFYLLNF